MDGVALLNNVGAVASQALPGVGRSGRILKDRDSASDDVRTQALRLIQLSVTNSAVSQHDLDIKA